MREMYTVCHERTQHGIGQGSFHSGWISIKIRDELHGFDYVYDCGALSNRRRPIVLSNAISKLKTFSGSLAGAVPHGKPIINAFVISHFDSDHMNGGELLAGRFDIGRIYVPYISPVELGLEIVRLAKAGAPSLKRIEELFAVAHGGPLWGVPVTRVAGSEPPPDDEPADRDFFERPEKKRRDEDSPTGERSEIEELSGSTRAVVGESEVLVSDVLNHKDSVYVKVGNMPVWKFRFWNYGIQQGLSVLVLSMLYMTSFPVEALNVSSEAPTLFNWLKCKANRDEAIGAYKRAIRLYNRLWSENLRFDLTANRVSLALFSGPQTGAELFCMRFDTHGPSSDEFSRDTLYGLVGCQSETRMGWLGTGDIPLGEAKVWEEFSQHFNEELQQLRTVLIPHHGAAPKHFPYYYNVGLNAIEGTFSVISYGDDNTYGHPQSSVVNNILSNKGCLKLVTENSSQSYRERGEGKLGPLIPDADAVDKPAALPA